MVPGAVVTCMVELPPEVTDEGVNDTMAAAGAPEEPSATVCGPLTAVVSMVVVAELPAATLADGGAAPMVKSGGGGAASTANAKLWVAGLPNPLLAVMVIGYELLEPVAGVPARAAVPLPLSVNVTPEGRAPVSDSTMVGLPAAVTVKLPAVPWVKVALLTDVMVGGVLTVRVKVAVWVAVVPVPVTVTVYCPGVAFTGGVTDSVEDPPDVTDCGLSDTSDPVGAPVALSPTV